MRHLSPLEIFNNRPPLDQETNWVRMHLRIIFRLIQINFHKNPLFPNSPDHYLTQMSNSFMYIPSCGMLAFWLVAIRGRASGEGVLTALLRMYAAAEDDVTFRAVAFPGYKQGRSYVPRGRGNEQ
jgi:hypothetical protein